MNGQPWSSRKAHKRPKNQRRRPKEDREAPRSGEVVHGVCRDCGRRRNLLGAYRLCDRCYHQMTERMVAALDEVFGSVGGDPATDDESDERADGRIEGDDQLGIEVRHE